MSSDSDSSQKRTRLTSHPFWNEIYDADYRTENSANRSIYGPFLTTVWGQDLPNYGYGAGAAYNYFITSTSNECPGGIMEHKCLTGCVATAMAQIMKYWNYPVFRYGKSVQYDWCNMPDLLNYYLPSYVPNPAYEIQRNAIARLMADCGEAADMHYCYRGCQSFTWPINARNALVDSFHYSSDAVRRLRSSYSAQTWKNFLIQDLQNGRPVLYAGASLASGGYEMSGHAFVCDGYNSGTDLFHFNWGWNGSYNSTWCALDAIIIDDYNYNHFERAVFNIHPANNDNYCDFDLQLWQHYITYYNPAQTAPLPHNNVPSTATRLFSVPISVPNGSGNYYFDASWRTIPSSVTSEYVAHKEVVLQPGFTASNGCNFTARIEPCAECESERGQSSTPADADERNLVSQHQVVETVCTPSLQIFPNPANSTVTLQLADPQDEIRQITVANMQGQVMLSQTVNATTPYTLNISALPAGIYAVCVLTANGQTLTGKVVKFG